jgi:glycosyltransferase involved in cell wall biosynthesis
VVEATTDHTSSGAGLAVSVVMPCLDEEANIQECVVRARRALEENAISGEVIVVDNASEDHSAELAAAAGATVVNEPRRGYGYAYLAGFAAARGEYVVMIDADLTYDFGEIPNFVRCLDEGAELVVGNRLAGLEPGSMHLLNRVGNALLSGFLNMLFRTPLSDAHCGLRAMRRDALERLDLQSGGMELASEMVIRASREHLVVRELPIALHPRAGESKLSRFRDGWRHLRLILVYNPTFLFVVPGLVLLAVGSILMLLVLADVTISGRGLFVHTLIGASLLVVVGTQLVAFGLCARTYAVFQLGDRDRLLEAAQRRLGLEHGLALGGLVVCGGVALGGVVVGRWISEGFGPLAEERLAVVAATLVIVGTQIFFTSFLLSIMGLRRRAG